MTTEREMTKEEERILLLIVKQQMTPGSLKTTEQDDLETFFDKNKDIYLALYDKALIIAGEALMEKSQEYWAKQLGLRK